MEAGAPPPDDAAPAAPAAPAAAPSASTHPKLTVPQILSFIAFAIFVGCALIASSSKTALVTSGELKELRKLTLFLIGALLPSDALIRFGRNLLFQTIDDPDTAASNAPATTLAQILAFVAFLIIVGLALVSHKLITSAEFNQVNEVGRVLIVALLPSDAGIRFGRALYYRAPTTPTPGPAQLARV